MRFSKRDWEVEVGGGGGLGRSRTEPGSLFPSVHPTRGQRVCELRSNGHPTVAAGQDGSLPVQRLWPLSQDERAEQAPHPAQEAPGKTQACLHRCAHPVQGFQSSRSTRTHIPHPFPIHKGSQLCMGPPILNLSSQSASRNPILSLHCSFHPRLHTGITLGHFETTRAWGPPHMYWFNWSGMPSGHQDCF